MKNLDIIGLTGTSGSGKSECAKIFAKRGIYVIDCDKLAKITISGEKCSNAIRKKFPEAFNSGGNFDKKKAAALFFSDKNKLREYEKIVFPFITYKIVKAIEALTENLGEENKSVVLIDAPTLYQSGANDFCKKIIAVIADEELTIKRVIARDNIDREQALSRLNSQFDKEYFAEKADFIIENNGALEELTAKINKIGLN